MWGGAFLCLVFLLGSSSGETAFRFGTVLTTEQEIGLTIETTEAKLGYKFYIDTVNAQNGGRGFFLPKKPNSTDGFYFKYEFLWKEDFGEASIHRKQLEELVKHDKVHFIGGSQVSFAEEEMNIAHENGLINYHCCVEPANLYKNDQPTVFGVPACNTEYTKNFISALFLADVGRVAILSDESDHLSQTTCEAAIEYFHEIRNPLGNTDIALKRNFNASSTLEFQLEDVVDDMIDQRIDAVIGCFSTTDGKLLVDALHDRKHSLKAIFLTRGPTHYDWISSFDPPMRAVGLVSGLQFHRSLKHSDAFFGSTEAFADLFYEKHGEYPICAGAAASAVGVTLTEAIRMAFEKCDISKTEGDVDRLLYDPESIVCKDKRTPRGYDRVVNAMTLLDMDTFFGKVTFNPYGQNVGKVPVTTQIFERVGSNGEKHSDVEVIFPVSSATELPDIPTENRYKIECLPGTFIGPDSYNPCIPCPKGEVSYEYNAAHCESCPIGEWTDQEGQSSCNKCPEGTITLMRGATSNEECSCLPGYFSVNITTGMECWLCPEGLECPGGSSTPVILSGYWANASHLGEVYACDPPSVCLGGPVAECEAGYDGRFCSHCAEGYFTMMEKCYTCISPLSLTLFAIALLFGWYFLNVTVSRSVSSLEMLLEWAQLANIIGDVDLKWTHMLKWMFGVANILDFDVDILEPSCFIMWGFKRNFIMQLLLPFIMSAMSAVAYLGSAIAFFAVERNWIRFEGKRKRFVSIFVEVPKDVMQLHKKWDSTVASFLASVDVTYLTIATYCLGVFQCRKVSGVPVLFADSAVQCHTQEHRNLIILASFGIIFYVIGYPVYVSWKLLDLSKKRTFSNDVCLRRYGFIYKKFELSYFFTPAISIVRKLLFVAILIFVSNPAFQVGALAAIATASLMIHVYTAPYVDVYMDVLFSFLLVALMFEAFSGLMFYSDNFPEGDRQILEWIVLSTLIVLLAVFLAIFLLELIRKYQITYVKKAYLSFALYGNLGVTNFFNFYPSMKRGSPTGSKEDINVSFELLETFKPNFIYNTLRKKPEFVKEWNRLTNLLKDFMADKSDTSYLSMEPVAKFWRKLVDHFPELVDFLAVADAVTLEKFNDVATNLYRNFFLTKKVSPLPLMEAMNWRDYAPMAQWLAIASHEDRDYFLSQIVTIFRTNGKEEAAEVLEMKLIHGGHDPFLKERGNGFRSDRRQRYLTTINEGSHPFLHSASLRTQRPNALPSNQLTTLPSSEPSKTDENSEGVKVDFAFDTQSSIQSESTIQSSDLN